MLVMRGQIFLADLSQGQGKEQSGTRSVVVVSSRRYLETVLDLVVVLPCTTRDRGWDNHVHLRGNHRLTQDTFAEVEQVRTISRTRLLRSLGFIGGDTLAEIDMWLHYMVGAD